MGKRRRLEKTGALMSMVVGMLLMGGRGVKAATVTYDLSGVTDIYGGSVTGSFNYDTSTQTYTNANFVLSYKDTGASYTLTNINAPITNLQNLFVNGPSSSAVDLNFTQILDGTNGQTVTLATGSFDYDQYHGANSIYGKVIEQPASASAPEPAEILGTVGALAMGVALRRKKRMISALNKANSAVV